MARAYQRKRVQGVELSAGVEHAGKIPPLVQLAGDLWGLDEDGRAWRFMHHGGVKGRWVRDPLKGVDESGRLVELPRFKRLHLVGGADGMVMYALAIDGTQWRHRGAWAMLSRAASILTV